MVAIWVVVLLAALICAIFHRITSAHEYNKGYKAGANRVLKEWKEHLSKSEEE